ncbi:MAG: DUF3068 domain-containing protein [Actinobacteria bacterium]|nr:DUF3068 domain-containing protein [Actinomycetota bacterium]
MKKKTKVLIIALVTIGILLIAMAPIWSKVILPGFIRVNDDIEFTMQFEGTLLLNVDPASFNPYALNQEISLPITLSWTLKSIPGKSSADVIAIDEVIELKSRTGQNLATIKHIYDMDRKTGQNVIGEASDQERKGYLIPFDLKPGVFESWDNETVDVIRLQFVKEETRDGEDYKDVRVYLFDITVDSEKIVGSPLGFPTEISGAMLKRLTSNPGLPVTDDQQLPVAYYTTISSITAFEPTTGIMVDTPVYNRTYYVNTALQGEQDNLVEVASLDYKRTGESIRETVDLAAKHAATLDFARKWVPVIFLIAGLLLLAVAVFIYIKYSARKSKPRGKRRKKSGKATSYDNCSDPDGT